MRTGGAGLVDALGACQVAEGEFADGADARGRIGGRHVDDEQAVRAAGVGIDVVAAHRALLKTSLHYGQYLLR